ncbi:MAG: transcription termination/antitermination protein NusA [Acidobacteria bacterium]|nr:MAG: transcription termination/antitermination protein NusA [Acidobacteriota bacterium]
MAQPPLLQQIEDLARQKGIDRDVIIRAVEDAFAAASRKVTKSRENLVSRLDRESGEFKVYAKKRVVPEVEDPAVEISLEEAIEIDPDADFDQELLFQREVPDMGRIAAQAAKQVIYQKVKEAERTKVYNEYIDRVGELINAIVKRTERGDVVVDLGTTEGIIPRREQIRGEMYKPGERVRGIIVDVERSGKGPQVVISRADPRLVMKLFEMEVPEIYDGTVRIISVARDAGERTKIAVQSRDRDVDPVGACVGMKGNRVQSVIRELRGEKIDIVQYHDDPLAFIREALKPATANRVILKDKAKREAEVIVADEQLSLAIGKRGQNVRLAGRLVGWRIDIKSETEKHVEIEAEAEARERAEVLFRRLDLDEAIVAALVEAGFRDLDQLIAADLEDLTRVPGVDVDLALHIHDRAEELYPVVQQELEEARRLAEELAAAKAEESDAVAELFAAEEAPEGEAGGPPETPPEDGGVALGQQEESGSADGDGGAPVPDPSGPAPEAPATDAG